MMASYKDSLPPPQQYETTIIAKYKSLDNLLNFALEKARKGSQLYLPVSLQYIDVFVSIYVLYYLKKFLKIT